MAHERVVSHAGLCVRPAPGCGKTLCPPCPTGAVDEMSVATSLDQADPVAFRVVEDAENEAAEVGRARSVKPARPTIVVVGETKRGKSSLINALVNVPGLSPVDPQVATSTYITIQHGPQLTARAIFLRITSGSSSTSTMPCGEDDDLLILAVGSCRS